MTVANVYQLLDVGHLITAVRPVLFGTTFSSCVTVIVAAVANYNFSRWAGDDKVLSGKRTIELKDLGRILGLIIRDNFFLSAVAILYFYDKPLTLAQKVMLLPVYIAVNILFYSCRFFFCAMVDIHTRNPLLQTIKTIVAPIDYARNVEDEIRRGTALGQELTRLDRVALKPVPHPASLLRLNDR